MRLLAKSGAISAPKEDRRFPLLVFGAVAALLIAVATLAAHYLPHYGGHPRFFPNQPWLAAWSRWDAGWYVGIADNGYWLRPGEQSSVAFFPGYPLSIRALKAVVGNSYLAGMIITLASGFGAAALFFWWCKQRMETHRARISTLVLLLYPFAFFLVAAVYSDALFLFAALGAFLLLENDRPWLAGVTAAFATATRPVGLALVAGLWLRALEKRGAFSVERPDGVRIPRVRLRLSWLTQHEVGLLLAPLGFIAFCAFLWYRFGDPFAFSSVMGAYGWDQPPGPATWFKVSFFKALADFPPARLGHLRISTHAVVTIPALVLIPGAFRRFGPAYGMYAALALAVPLVSSKDFMGMGRYILAAFPCFAVAGDLLASRPHLVKVALFLSGILLLVTTSIFSLGYYLS